MNDCYDYFTIGFETDRRLVLHAIGNAVFEYCGLVIQQEYQKSDIWLKLNQSNVEMTAVYAISGATLAQVRKFAAKKIACLKANKRTCDHSAYLKHMIYRKLCTTCKMTVEEKQYFCPEFIRLKDRGRLYSPAQPFIYCFRRLNSSLKDSLSAEMRKKQGKNLLNYAKNAAKAAAPLELFIKAAKYCMECRDSALIFSSSCRIQMETVLIHLPGFCAIWYRKFLNARLKNYMQAQRLLFSVARKQHAKGGMNLRDQLYKN